MFKINGENILIFLYIQSGTILDCKISAWKQTAQLVIHQLNWYVATRADSTYRWLGRQLRSQVKCNNMPGTVCICKPWHFLWQVCPCGYSMELGYKLIADGVVGNAAGVATSESAGNIAASITDYSAGTTTGPFMPDSCICIRVRGLNTMIPFLEQSLQYTFCNSSRCMWAWRQPQHQQFAMNAAGMIRGVPGAHVATLLMHRNRAESRGASSNL